MQIDTYKFHHIHFLLSEKRKEKKKSYDNSNIDALVSLLSVPIM